MSSTTSTTLTEERRLELLEERQESASRKFQLPQARSFDELFEALDVWDHERFNARAGVEPADRPPATQLDIKCWQCGGSGKRATAVSTSGRELARHERSGTPCRECKGRGTLPIEVGPFCQVERQKQRDTHNRGSYGLAVKPTKITLDAIAGWLVGDANEHWGFRIIDHGEIALVIAESSLIIGGPWIAYIDPATIPTEESLRIHKAEPGNLVEAARGRGHCKRCGAVVKRVPGGQGPTWVHEDSGAVAAPNPPRSWS